MFTQATMKVRPTRNSFTRVGEKTARLVFNSHPALASIFALVFTLVLSFAFKSAGSAQGEDSYVQLVRALGAEETGHSHPAGLVYSQRANAFYVLEAQAQGEPLTATTAINKLDSYAGKLGSAQIAAQVQNPVNVTFDGKANRLLILQNKDLVEVPEDLDGNLVSQKPNSYDLSRLGLQDPQGISVDPVNGHLFILDATGPQIVRIAPSANGSFNQGSISTVILAAQGLGSVRGLAFDPTSGHLHVMSGKSLYEFTQAGELVASRDLAEFALADPQGLVFAPSGDLTDDPAELNLYLADGSQVVEFTLVAPVAVTADFTSSLIRTVDMGAYTPPSSDPSGLTYIYYDDGVNPVRDSLLMVDGEIEETVNGISNFQNVNIWEIDRLGNVIDTANTTKVGTTVVPMSNESVGVTWNPANGHYYISDDGSKDIFNLNPGADGILGTEDDTWTKWDTLVLGNTDPSGITLDTVNNQLYVADDLNKEIYQYTLNGTLVNHFDTEILGITAPESVEYNPDRGTLFILDSNRQHRIIIETTTAGGLLQTIDVSASFSLLAAGLAYAPASDGSAEMSFYIVDRGVDNNTSPTTIDGKMFEMTTPPPPPPINHAPVASDDTADTIESSMVTIAVFANDTDLDGNLDPASANTDCLTCSGPANGVLINNGNGSFHYTPDAAFIGNDSFVYEICDAGPLCDTASVSVTVNLRPPDHIFQSGFDKGNFLTWSSSTTDGGDLSVTTAAKLKGTHGLQARIDDNNPIYLTDDRPASERTYRARFYFDPNSIVMANGNAHFIFDGNMSATFKAFRLQFRYYGGQYQIKATVAKDASGWKNSTWYTISDAPHYIEIYWRAATGPTANNGGLTLWIDGVQKVDLTGVDNDTKRIESIQLGSVTGIDTGTRGTYYFDAFLSRRFTYIGAAP